MVKKIYSKTGRSCRVTFGLRPEGNTETASLCGDFTEWEKEAHPLKRRKDGRFSATISLKPNASYRYRYLLDGERWENDGAVDDLVDNPYGSQDSVVEV